MKNFIDSVDGFLKDNIGDGFNKLVLKALYPPDGAEPPTIPQLETAWADILPTVRSTFWVLFETLELIYSML